MQRCCLLSLERRKPVLHDTKEDRVTQLVPWTHVWPVFSLQPYLDSGAKRLYLPPWVPEELREWFCRVPDLDQVC